MNVLKIILTTSATLFILIFLILWSLNQRYTDIHIPVIHIGAVSALYILYFCALSLVFWYFSKGSWLGKVVWTLIYLTVGATLLSVVHGMVYGLLPKLSIVLFDESVPPNEAAFHHEVWRGYLFANALAIGFVFFLYYWENRWLSRRLINKLNAYHQRMLGVKHNSHFLGTIFVTGFGRMLVETDSNNKQVKRDIIQFLGYLMRIEEPHVQHSWEEELDLLECFVRLWKEYYGPDSLQVDCDIATGEYCLVPWGILLFPLENCLKHALISAVYPVDYQLKMDTEEVILICTNWWSPKEQKEGGVGFELLESRLLGTGYKLRYHTEQTEGRYKLTLHLNWDNNEKIKLSSPAFG
ncbi:LytS family sensor histidine kinase [Sphingobacterium tabacisoli]|uniref:hypothetical protein n=1 Tax=Sphingobacterium tabacisoli TaxID=2044855 RepID=UPI001AED3370|nr:hypothetical protein [Sphingobacterium tabacisoli]